MARIDYCDTSKSNERTKEILGKNRNANIFRMMAHSPSYFEQYCRLGGAIRHRGELDPVQRAFVTAGAVQCGFCTPGLIVATHDLLRRVPSPSDEEIRESLAGNLCRCTGYEKILDAVRLAAKRVDA